MSVQFENYDYHDALYDGARQTLPDLHGFSKGEPLRGEGITGISERTDDFGGSTYALEYKTTYQATLFNDISERIVSSTEPPAYLLQVIGVYANALVDTVNDAYPHREVPFFKPNAETLGDHMHQIWMQGIRRRLLAKPYVPLYSVPMEPYSLDLARVDDALQLQYRHTKRYVRLGHYDK
jgi:hypothetical protein